MHVIDLGKCRCYPISDIASLNVNITTQHDTRNTAYVLYDGDPGQQDVVKAVVARHVEGEVIALRVLERRAELAVGELLTWIRVAVVSPLVFRLNASGGKLAGTRAWVGLVDPGDEACVRAPAYGPCIII